MWRVGFVQVHIDSTGEGGEKNNTTAFFFSLWREKKTPYKAEHDYSAVTVELQEHKALIGLRCQQ